MNPLAHEASQADIHKPKHKFRPHNKSRSKHTKGTTVSDDESGIIKKKGDAEPMERMTVERQEVTRNPSLGKTMFESIFHRRREYAVRMTTPQSV
jgi:hypothetical protein